MTDAVEKVARTWASMDGKPYGEGYVEDAAFLLRRSGVGRRIEELEEMLMSATMDGYDMAKNEYRSHIEELEAKLAKAVAIAKDAVETMESGPFFPDREGQRLLAALAELSSTMKG